jgi:hypothetical protein
MKELLTTTSHLAGKALLGTKDLAELGILRLKKGGPGLIGRAQLKRWEEEHHSFPYRCLNTKRQSKCQ